MVPPKSMIHGNMVNARTMARRQPRAKAITKPVKKVARNETMIGTFSDVPS